MKAFLFGLLLLFFCHANAQPVLQLVTPDVGFLEIAPDARAGALGQSGVATSPDAVSGFWNPAKTVRFNSDFGATVSTGPWVPRLTDGLRSEQVTMGKTG